MNLFPRLLALACLIPLAACEKKEEKPEATEKPSAASLELQAQDMPLLPLKKGDSWKYKVRVEIPPDITSEGAAAMDVEKEMERMYLGKMKIGDNEPEVDVFEVSLPGEKTTRELVEIHDNRIMMRGTSEPNGGNTVWLDPPVLFVFAGMRPGQETVKISSEEGVRQRDIQVVARETVTVPAGEFPAIRLLMTGSDAGFVLRKTTWFSPKTGIVKEEKTRYAGDKLLFRETTELVATNVEAK